jgi:hypothetical protein
MFAPLLSSLQDVCDRKICFFAHTESELRTVSPKSVSGLATATSEGSQHSSPEVAPKLLATCSEGETDFNAYLHKPFPATRETSMDFSTTNNSLGMHVARSSSLGSSHAFQRGGAILKTSPRKFQAQGSQFLGTPPFYAQVGPSLLCVSEPQVLGSETLGLQTLGHPNFWILHVDVSLLSRFQ